MILDKNNSIIKKNILIECYALYEGTENQCKKYIIPSSSKRDWMDEKEQQYAYYCSPLVTANQAGYTILYQNETEVFWDGGKNTSNVKIIHKKQNEYFSHCLSHFSVGIVTFSFPVIFKTPPGWGLLVSGYPNNPINGLQPLEAIVETNWSPFTFTMNFKITEKNKLITIKENTPICRILPYPLNLNEKTNIKFLNIKNNKELNQQHSAWVNSRLTFNESKREKNSHRQFFYRDGKDSSGNKIAEGKHKLDYKFNIDEEKISKCPFLFNLFNKNK
jgi:hypothetical protein